jgi:outer membrane usher protein
MTLFRRTLAALLLAFAADASAQGIPPLTAPAVPTAAAYPSIVALRLNGELVSEGLLIMRAGPGGKLFYLGAAEARRLRLVLAGRAPPVRMDNEDFHPLDGVAGLTYQFDEIGQVLALTAIPELFDAQQITLPSAALVDATRPGFGAFLTYDVISQRTNAPGQLSLSSGQMELGIFSPYGVFTQSAFGTASGREREAIRLDSTFTIDQPASLASWQIGDTITRSAGWSPLARFGGVRYGTNFATQPALVTYPLTAMVGQTALPSVVDVYVNNVLNNTLQVPAGPFTLNELPTVNGQGQLRLVVRDLLGREQVYMQSLYGSTALLRPGLDDWTVQAGALRENYGIASNQYGAGFASGVWRRGVNENLTISPRAAAPPG